MKSNLLIALFALGVFTTSTVPASAQGVLTGDTRLACEALLCLSTGKMPSECVPSIQRYFSISFKSFTDTLRGRINFLNLCPASSQSADMGSLVNAISNGAGRCDASSLNRTLLNHYNSVEDWMVVISNQMPGYCSAYTTHQFTDLGDTAPKYVGIPERGGYWIDAKDYAGALAAYNARILAEDQAAVLAAMANGNGGD